MSEKHQECSECGKPLAHRIHSPTYGTHAYREPVASPQATRSHDDCDCPCEKCADGGEHCGKKPCDCAAQPAAGTPPRPLVTCNAHEGVHQYNVECKSPYESSEGTTPHSYIDCTVDDCEQCRPINRALDELQGTTPQAERLHPHGCYCNDCYSKQYLHSRRAVAPVETPDDELCQNCHRENPVWFAPNAVWNAVVTEISGILCPICFINRAERQGFRCTGWELVPELVDRPTDDKTPVGVGAPANLAPVETPTNRFSVYPWLNEVCKKSGWSVGRFVQFAEEHGHMEDLADTLLAWKSENTPAVETRLTAEQFYEQWLQNNKFETHPTREQIYQLLEAFRDKSEAELRAKLAEQQEIVQQCHVMTREADALFKQEMRFRRAAEAEAAALRERCETFVEHVCSGSALCKECGKALAAAPERGKDGKS